MWPGQPLRASCARPVCSAGDRLPDVPGGAATSNARLQPLTCPAFVYFKGEASPTFPVIIGPQRAFNGPLGNTARGAARSLPGSDGLGAHLARPAAATCTVGSSSTRAGMAGDPASPGGAEAAPTPLCVVCRWVPLPGREAPLLHLLPGGPRGPPTPAAFREYWHLACRSAGRRWPFTKGETANRCVVG